MSKKRFSGISTSSTSKLHFEQLEVPVPFTSYTYITVYAWYISNSYYVILFSILHSAKYLPNIWKYSVSKIYGRMMQAVTPYSSILQIWPFCLFFLPIRFSFFLIAGLSATVFFFLQFEKKSDALFFDPGWKVIIFFAGVVLQYKVQSGSESTFLGWYWLCGST